MLLLQLPASSRFTATLAAVATACEQFNKQPGAHFHAVVATTGV